MDVYGGITVGGHVYHLRPSKIWERSTEVVWHCGLGERKALYEGFSGIDVKGGRGCLCQIFLLDWMDFSPEHRWGSTARLCPLGLMIVPRVLPPAVLR
jgi:hypothetical protein